MRLIVSRGLAPALTGLAIGLTASAALTRFLSSLLFEVTGTDVPTYAAAASVLAALSLAAIFIPARRAAGVDPINALRHE